VSLGHHPPHQPTHEHARDELRVGSLCTGYGGLDIAVQAVLGGRLAWYAETDRHACTVLAHHFPTVANLGDIRTVDWTTVAPVDIVTAGFPCQDISDAGKREGITGALQPLARRRRRGSRPSTRPRLRGERRHSPAARPRRRPGRPGRARVRHELDLPTRIRCRGGTPS
jgi:hypothetical protein